MQGSDLENVIECEQATQKGAKNTYSRNKT